MTTLPPGLDSAEMQAFATGFPTTLAHLGVSLALLAAGATLYVWLTPWKEFALIRRGNVAAATAFAAVLIGLAAPLAVSLSASLSIRDILVWGVAAVVVQLLVFRLVDFLLPGLAKRIGEGEVAAAVALAGVKLATALLLAAAMTG